MEISTVIGCRMNCTYCPQKTHVSKYVERSRNVQMSFDDYTTILSKIPPGREITFAGMAEPWLNPRCTDMIQHTLDHGHPVIVYTTTVGMTPQDAERIQKMSISRFVIHLPDKDGMMTLKVDKDYLDVLAMVIKREYIPMVIGELHPYVKPLVGDVRMTPGNEPISRAGNVNHIPHPFKTGPIYCAAMPNEMNQNVILPNGDVVICCMDYSQEQVIGNLLTMSYDELYQSLEYKRMRSAMLGYDTPVICRKCEVAKSVV